MDLTPGGFGPRPVVEHRAWHMSESPQEFPPIFFEVYESLPRQGPGNRACAERAVALCTELPHTADVLDLGCGSGAQTLILAEILSGSIVAVDRHVASVDRLRANVDARGLADRIRPVVGDMARLELPAGSFDLVWSEGAFYNLGIASALDVCRGLLRRGGYVAFTDAVWRRENAPPEVEASFAADYPTMGRVDDVLTIIAEGGFLPVGHFTLPDEAWWDDFYGPMEMRIEELRSKYAGDRDALAVLDQIAKEPAMHRRYCDYYGYEFFVARWAG